MKLVHGGDTVGYRERYGHDALDFSANVSPLGLPEGVAQAIREALAEADRYPDPLCRELTAAQWNAGTFANSAAIVRAMEPVPRMPRFIWVLLLLSQFSKIAPIRIAYLRYAVCGCCLCIKNANCYEPEIVCFL